MCARVYVYMYVPYSKEEGMRDREKTIPVCVGVIILNPGKLYIMCVLYLSSIHTVVNLGAYHSASSSLWPQS